VEASIAAGTIVWVRSAFNAEHVEGAFLVVAATDDEAVNAAVAEAAGRVGALVCDASSAERSQVVFGATLALRGATIAVFTDGRDPGGARRTRDRIAALLERAT
jgi:siroheme synthase-like protein